MTNYEKGYRFELKVKKSLEEKGAYVVRSAGSKGIVDLIAIYPSNGSYSYTEVEIYQCKRTKTSLTQNEKDRIKEFTKKYSTTVWIVRSDPINPKEFVFTYIDSNGKENNG